MRLQEAPRRAQRGATACCQAGLGLAPAFVGTHVLHLRHRERGGRRFHQQLGAAQAARRVSAVRAAHAADTTAVERAGHAPELRNLSARAGDGAVEAAHIEPHGCPAAVGRAGTREQAAQLYRQSPVRVGGRAFGGAATQTAGGSHLHTPAPPCTVRLASALGPSHRGALKTARLARA